MVRLKNGLALKTKNQDTNKDYNVNFSILASDLVCIWVSFKSFKDVCSF